MIVLCRRLWNNWMMNIVLVGINAKYIHSNPAIYSLRAYAKARLEKEKGLECNIWLAEYTINQQKEEIIADLYQKKPDILAFSCYIWNWSMVQQLLRTFHKLCPQVPIWLGGPEVSFTPEEILKEHPYLAGIMVGEGEETFTELCRFYRQKGLKAGEADRGLKQPIDGTVTARGRGEERGLTCLDDIPFFYEDMEDFVNRIVYYESSRGCPYRCSYCLSAIDKSLRLRSLERVEKELQFFLDNRVPQVKFIDRTFNANHRHARAIWQYLIEHDNGVTNFHFEIAADIITQEELELLFRMRPGLVQLEIGVQTTNSCTLQAINRPMKVEKVKEVAEAIGKRHNVHLHLDLIAGLPFEDYESFGNSFNQVYGLRPNQLQLGFLKVLKGSPLWERARDYGIVYEDHPPYEVLYTKWLSFEEVLKLKQVERVLEIYYNSGQFNYTVAMLEKEFLTPFAFYEALADFADKDRQAFAGSARSQRYQLLLDFVAEKVPDRIEMYRQLLTFDLYLREKIKTRPDFCGSLEQIRQISRNFYQQEERDRKYLPDYEEYTSKQLAKLTHLEAFGYSVWKRGTCEKLKENILVLFDYRTRDPLTAEADIQLIAADSLGQGIVIQ